jgi:hypothetical protein
LSKKEITYKKRREVRGKTCLFCEELLETSNHLFFEGKIGNFIPELLAKGQLHP